MRPRTRLADACPNVRRHTPRPEGYGDFMDWAEKKAKTHVQTRCPDCGLWTIWKPKKKAAPKQDGEASEAAEGTGS